MEKTLHSLTRCRQRGIPENNLEVIRQWGTPVRKPGGVIEYFISRKDKQEAINFLKQCIQAVEKLTGKAIIVSSDDTVITAYHKTR